MHRRRSRMEDHAPIEDGFDGLLCGRHFLIP